MKKKTCVSNKYKLSPTTGKSTLGARQPRTFFTLVILLGSNAMITYLHLVSSKRFIQVSIISYDRFFAFAKQGDVGDNDLIICFIYHATLTPSKKKKTHNISLYNYMIHNILLIIRHIVNNYMSLSGML